MIRKLLIPVALVVFGAAASLTGCDARGEAETAVAGRAPVHVDSIFPIGEEIRRFNATLAYQPATLSGGAASRDELVQLFFIALEKVDSAAFAAMALDREEFGYLYYPHTRFTRRPYELSPALVWFQLENYSSKGLKRAAQRHGGRPLTVLGYTCEATPAIEERNRIWSGCVVRIAGAYGEPLDVGLLGPIIERDGHFKFVSYANRL